MSSPMTARTIQFVARLVAIALLVLIALAIKGVPSSQAAGVMPAVAAAALPHAATATIHEAVSWANADATTMEPGASVAAYER